MEQVRTFAPEKSLFAQKSSKISVGFIWPDLGSTESHSNNLLIKQNAVNSTIITTTYRYQLLDYRTITFMRAESIENHLTLI